VKIETDHIEPAAENGTDNIDNAIPVCFDCHAEIHSYNDKHPRGRKFGPEELRKHKEQWLGICDNHPESLTPRNGLGDTEVGPIQALIDEIEFNIAAAKQLGCPLRDEQFSRAIRSGSISLMVPKLKAVIIDAYVAAGRAGVLSVAATTKRAGGVGKSVSGAGSGDPKEALVECSRLLMKARAELLRVLGNGESGG